MAFVPVLNTAKVSIEHTLDSQVVVNTMWFEKPAGWDIFGITSFVNNFAASWISNMMPQLSEALELLQVVARDYTTQFSVAASFASTGVLGGITGECAPSNVSLALKFETGLVGRSRRGRNFICGIPNSKITQNAIDGAWAADVLAAYQVVTSDVLGSDGANHSVVSFHENGLANNPANIFTVTSYGFTDLIADSQRRRLPGRGA